MNVLKIITNSPELLGYKIQTLDNKIKFLNEIGYSNDDISYMMQRSAIIVLKDKESILKIIKYFNKHLDINTVLKIIKSNPNILCLNINSFETKKSYFIKKGYTKDEFFKLLTRFPQIMGLNSNNLDEKINTFIKLGFEIKDIKDMTLILPSIFGYSTDNIYNKIINIMDLEFNKKETINILKKTPQLFGYNIENIREKVEFLNSIGLKSLIIENSNILIPSKETLEERYIFLTERNEFTPKVLYMKNKQFDNKYRK